MKKQLFTITIQTVYSGLDSGTLVEYITNVFQQGGKSTLGMKLLKEGRLQIVSDQPGGTGKAKTIYTINEEP